MLENPQDGNGYNNLAVDPETLCRLMTSEWAHVLVKHLLSGDYLVFCGAECIARARGLRPKPSTNSNRNNDKDDDPGG